MFPLRMSEPSSKAYALVALLVALVAISVADQHRVVQSGRRFPLGIQLDVEDVACNSTDDNGLLRFEDNNVQYCNNGEWISVGENETVSINGQILDLRSRVVDLEGNVYPPLSLESLNDRMERNNELLEVLTHGKAFTAAAEAIKMCNYHGVYNMENFMCDCHCSAALGCWSPRYRCSTCTIGWTGDRCDIDIEYPVLTVLGDDVITHEAGDVYVDPQAVAWDNRDLNITTWIVTDNPVIDDLVGSYVLTYTVTDEASHTVSDTRTVHVVDTTKPTVSLNGDAVVTIEAGDGFTDPGVTATDNAQGVLTYVDDLSAVPLRLTGTYTVTYTVTDAEDNFQSVERTIVVVDTTPPVIRLRGTNPLTHQVPDGAYVDPGAYGVDNAVDPIPAVENDHATAVNGTLLGNYTVTFTLTDANGNEAESKTRLVVVVEDVNECTSGSHDCDPRAECSNTIGSYLCECSGATIGDGYSCVEATSAEFGGCGRYYGQGDPGWNSCDNYNAWSRETRGTNHYNGLQNWNVTEDGWYLLEAYGAEGGYATDTSYMEGRPGRGAYMSGYFRLRRGQQLQILPGSMGGPGSYVGAGGGGSFVVLDGQPLVIAGGGGGSGRIPSTTPYDYGYGVDAQTTTAGTESHHYTTSNYFAGMQGNGGYANNNAGSGAGFKSYHSQSYHGFSWFYSSAPMYGGSSASGATQGGLGGGGGTHASTSWGGGGGGGYSGGAGAYTSYYGGGGGGSINTGVGQKNEPGFHLGMGKVRVTLVAGGRDECTEGTHDCHEQATCIDLPSSAGKYECRCKSGWYGNGRECLENIAVDVTLTTCGREHGYEGKPNRYECLKEYQRMGQTDLTIEMSTTGYQLWTVPYTGTYDLEAIGASGGSAYSFQNSHLSLVGNGARIRAQFNFQKGQQLKIVVGSRGSMGSSCGGGGGGTFVATTENEPLLVAGGGGGACYLQRYHNSFGRPGVVSVNGTKNRGQYAGDAGTVGNGGNGYSSGGGFYQSGSTGYNGYGQSFVNGATGGSWSGHAHGGFGGGGGAHSSSSYCGGAGGGYSGGGGCTSSQYQGGGGGGSFSAGNGTVGDDGFNYGPGRLRIRLVIPDIDQCIEESISCPNGSSCVNLLDDESDVGFECRPDTPLSHKFVPCYYDYGSNPPSASHCSSYEYIDTNAPTVTIDDGVQVWTVPRSGFYKVTAGGASGGRPSNYVQAYPGRGAIVRSTFWFDAGEEVKLLIGQRGQWQSNSAGGGGGTFVTTSEDEPLLVAGGGGGAVYYPHSNYERTRGVDASFTEEATPAQNMELSFPGYSGRGGGRNYNAGAGGGFYTDAEGCCSYSSRGYVTYHSDSSNGGGFGGGGGTSSSYGGGAGGGYSGGGAPDRTYFGGGGGSSFSASLDGIEAVGYNERDAVGFVDVEYVVDLVDECELGTHDCDVHATCVNTYGSYGCLCNEGYYGDGKRCAAGSSYEAELDTCGYNYARSYAPSPSVTVCRNWYNQLPKGPSYSNDIVSVSNGKQVWRVPVDGWYEIEAWGAEGGRAYSYGGTRSGRGAYVKGMFNLTAGEDITVVVGVMGRAGSECGGGGGGTFIAKSDNSPMLVAGGGGGAGRPSEKYQTATGRDGTIEERGTLDGSDMGYPGFPGHGGRLGSRYFTTSVGRPGGGFYSGGYDTTYGGKAFTNNAYGGQTWSVAYGGFGGGGGTHGGSSYGGGGGGGYSGGAMPIDSYVGGGGGGSFNGGVYRDSPGESGVKRGNGLVRIRRVAPDEENACYTGTHNCDANAECLPGIGYYKCQCSSGYVGNGFVCEDGDAFEVEFETCGNSYGRTLSGSCVNWYQEQSSPLASQVSESAGVQKWTVPEDGTYLLTAYGAAGGWMRSYASSRPGRGAIVRAEFELRAGDVLDIVIGQRGTGESSWASGGGGGTFVVNSTDNSPMLIAGGGGGVSRHFSSYFRTCNGMDASVTEDGTPDACGRVQPGSNGQGGSGYNNAGGGGGFYSNGNGGYYGYGWNSNKYGGSGSNCEGGLGGGAASHCGSSQEGGGGGGGYSGGAGGYNQRCGGGGGGSYMGGVPDHRSLGWNDGPGRLLVKRVVTDRDECAMGLHKCDANANCINTRGSYECECATGYSGDGYLCVAEDIEFEFTDCGRGAYYTGPSESQCSSAYSGTSVTLDSVSDGKQAWTVPTSGLYTIDAWGAAGGAPSDQPYNAMADPGRGAHMRGEFFLEAGETLVIAVGQPGQSYSTCGGGGGGTFIVNATSQEPLVIAAGGGASGGTQGYAYGAVSIGRGGTAEECGLNSQDGGGHGGCYGMRATRTNSAGYGGGFYDGGSGYDGASWDQGLNGGSSGHAQGGFGGGGSCHSSYYAGGGGGGFFGGGGGHYYAGGGGGGSLNRGYYKNTTGEGNVNSGSGRVLIRRVLNEEDYCAPGAHECDVNAECVENEGGYHCVCNDGYIGDGKTCTSGTPFKQIFHPCYRTGYRGPTSVSHCAYSSELNALSTFTVNGQGKQTFTVPETGVYRITAVAARGYLCSHSQYRLYVNGGQGASMSASFALSAGDVLDIFAGQVGAESSNSGGGGGASGVSNGSTPLVIAGGGGGGGYFSSGFSYAHGQPGRRFTEGGHGSPGQYYGAVNGQGGQHYGNSGGGAGWLTSGSGSTSYSGTALSSTAIGGSSYGQGGFGGGGTGYTSYGGGGGGGYSGGSVANNGRYEGGGGGGSFVGASGFDIEAHSGFNERAGYVVLERIG